MTFRLLATTWLLYTIGRAANTTTDAHISSIGIADHINHGLGIETSSQEHAKAISNHETNSNGTLAAAATATRSKDISSNGQRTTQIPTSSSTYDRYAFTLDTQDYGRRPSYPPFTQPASGSGREYASKCNLELLSYSAMEYLTYGTAFPNTTLLPWTSYTASITTLCDGHKRVVGHPTAVTSGHSTTVYNGYTTYTTRPPSCSIAATDCSALITDYQSSSRAWNGDNDFPTSPICSVTNMNAEICGECHVVGGSVQMLYFPVATDASRDMCATTPGGRTVCPFGATAKPTATTSNLLVRPTCTYIPQNFTKTTDSGPFVTSDGNTFYENRVYLKYETAYASNSCGRVGSNYAGGYITLASSDVYSMSGYHYYMSMDAYKFNFADLNPMVPASAFTAMFDCTRGGASYQLGNGVTMSGYDKLNGDPVSGFCSVFIDSDYRPVLPVPPALRALDPKWASCNLGLNGLFDPPSALTAAAVAASATLPVAFSSNLAAAPASTPTSPAVVTSAPNLTMPESKPPAPSPTLAQPIAASTGGASGLSKPISPAGDNLPPASQGISNDESDDDANPQFTFDPIATTITTTRSQAIITIFNGAQQQTITAIAAAPGGNANSIVIGSTTLSVGGAAAVIGGSTVSLASNGVVVNGVSTLSLAPTTNLVIDSVISTAIIQQAIITLADGNNSPIVINHNTPITALATIDSSGSPIVIVNNTAILSANSPAVTLTDGTILSANLANTGISGSNSSMPTLLIINGTRTSTVTFSKTTSLLHQTLTTALPTTTTALSNLTLLGTAKSNSSTSASTAITTTSAQSSIVQNAAAATTTTSGSGGVRIRGLACAIVMTIDAILFFCL